MIYIDGMVFGDHTMIGAIGVDAEGHKHVRDIAKEPPKMPPRPIRGDVTFTSNCFWIKVEILCVLFTPLCVIAVGALLNRFSTMLGETLGQSHKPLR